VKIGFSGGKFCNTRLIYSPVFTAILPGKIYHCATSGRPGTKYSPLGGVALNFIQPYFFKNLLHRAQRTLKKCVCLFFLSVRCALYGKKTFCKRQNMTNTNVQIKNIEVLSDNWYTLRKVVFDYRKKDGSWETQSREAYDRGNGAAILLYNREGCR